MLIKDAIKKIDKLQTGEKYWPKTFLTKDLYLEISSHINTEKGTIKT